MGPAGAPRITNHTPRIEFYQCTVNDRRASIRVDVGRHEAGSDPNARHSLRVQVPLRDPRPDGLTTAAEAETLGKFEDELLRALAPAIWVGALTTCGKRNWYFYCADPDALADRARATGAAMLPDHEIAVGSFEDPTWRQYFEFLYPNDLAWQWIEDRRTLDAFRDRGDDGEKPRPIDHWTYFARAEDRDGFQAAVLALGFVIIASWKNDEGDEPHVVQFRTSKDEPPVDIFARTERLALLAREWRGTYDGWEAPIFEA